MNKPRMLTIKEASKLIDGLTEFRIRQMCITGEIHCIMAGKKYLVNQSVLLEHIGEKI
ncbi:MAG: DNA-binding protein [Oscillospiraceae bacterium]|nr:DNA-binding protein [Oscillospiraceae bacterium]